MNPNPLASHDVALVGVVDPDLNTSGDHATGWIAAADHPRYLAIVAAGDIGTGGTIDAALEQATDAAGAGAKPIDGKTISITPSETKASCGMGRLVGAGPLRMRPIVS